MRLWELLISASLFRILSSGDCGRTSWQKTTIRDTATTTTETFQEYRNRYFYPSVYYYYYYLLFFLTLKFLYNHDQAYNAKKKKKKRCISIPLCEYLINLINLRKTTIVDTTHLWVLMSSIRTIIDTLFLNDITKYSTLLTIILLLFRWH